MGAEPALRRRHHLPIADGTNLYLATVIDCFSRRLAGWAVAEHMRTDLIVGALSAVLDTHGSLAGAIFHESGSRSLLPSPTGESGA
jgi:transposase InsO family protein